MSQGYAWNVDGAVRKLRRLVSKKVTPNADDSSQPKGVDSPPILSKKSLSKKCLRYSVLSVLLLSPAAFASSNFSVSVTAGGGATTILPGVPTTLQIELNNTTGSPLSTVSFSQSLPGNTNAGLRISGAASNSCGGTLTADPDTQLISLAGASISGDASCTISVPIVAYSDTGSSASHSYSLIAGSVSATRDAVGITNGTGGAQSYTVNAVSRPTWSKGFPDGNGTIILGGSTGTLRITVNNPASIPLTNFSFTDVFPTSGAGGAVIEPTGVAATGSCVGGSVGAVIDLTPGAAAQVAVSGGTLSAGQSCTIDVPIQARQTNGNYTLTSTNTLQTSSFNSDEGLRPASNASRNITVRSPLTVGKGFAASPLSSGEESTFTITLGNTGTTDLTGVEFTDSLPSGLSLSGVPSPIISGTGCTASSLIVNGNDLEASGITIPAGGTCTLTATYSGITGTSDEPTTYTNTIPQGDVTVVGQPGIISQSASATVMIADRLRVLKSRQTGTSAAPGNAVEYRVTVQNFSAAPISNVSVEDTLTQGSSFLTGTINGVDYTPSLSAACGVLGDANALNATDLEFTIPTLPGRASATSPGTCTISFWAMIDPERASGSTSNQIQSGQVCFNDGSEFCNQVPSDSVSYSYQSVVDVQKRFAGATSLTRSEGTVVQMRIRVRNFSSEPLIALTISDTLPGSGLQQLRVATPSNASTSCGGTIDAEAGSTSVALNAGTVPAATGGNAGECDLYVDVVGSAGIYDNTASVGGTQQLVNGSNRNILGVDSNTARVTYTSALSATKAFSPASVSSGGRSTVTIRLNNNDALPLTNVSVIDPLPTGMQLASPPNAYSSCAGNPVIVAAAGSDSLSMSDASIAGNSSCDLLFDVVASGSSSWVNTLPAGNITADNNISNQTPVSATLNHQVATVPTLSKGIVPANVAPGEAATLTITITNGVSAVSNLSVTDFFTLDGLETGELNGMRIASPALASTTCPAGNVQAQPNGTFVSLSGAALDAGAACEVSVRVTSVQPGTITNIIPQNSITTAQGVTNTSTSAESSMTTSTAVAVIKEFVPNVVDVNERARLRITFNNASPVNLTNFSIEDVFPSGLSVPAGPNSVTTCGPSAVVSWPGSDRVHLQGGVLAGATAGSVNSCYLELDVVANAAGEFLNTIPANSLEVGGTPITHPPTEDTLYVQPPLQVFKAIANTTLDNPAPGGFTTGSATTAAGVARTLTIRIVNPGATAVSGMQLTDSLPDGMVVAQPNPIITNSCNGSVTAFESATAVRLSGGTLAGGATCEITLPVLSNTPGNYINEIPAGALTTTEGVSNEEPTTAELIVATPPSVSKEFNPAVIPSGGTSRLTINIYNLNSQDMTLTQALVDNLPNAPGPMRVASTPNLGGTCSSVTAAANSDSITLASGATVPAGGCTIEVDVTATAAGEHINTIPSGALSTNLGSNEDPVNVPLLVSTAGYISGRVFLDNTSPAPNGSFESTTDQPLAGVLIELRSGLDCSGTLVGTTTTNLAGNYLFSGLAAGSYSVCETQPDGLLNGETTAGNPVGGGSSGTASNPNADASQITGVVLADLGGGDVSGSINNDFAEWAPSTLSGVVFEDHNNNGIQNGSDAGIPGQTIRLVGTDVNGVSINRETTTDANGHYSFTDLPPGSYAIEQPNQPDNTVNGQTIPGAVPNGTVGTPTASTDLPSGISSIVLPPNTISSNNNFAELPLSGTVRGQVFLDYDSSQSLNGPDHGIADQVIRLTGADVNGNPITQETTTDAQGNFLFTGLPAGTYTLEQPDQPAGTINLLPVAGSAGGTPANPGAPSSQISAIDLTNTTLSAGNLFPEVPGPHPDLTLDITVSNDVFSDGGGTGFYTLIPGNVGSADSSGTVTVVSELPPGVTFRNFEGTHPDWSCSIVGQTVTCTTEEVIPATSNAPNIVVQVDVEPGGSGSILTNHSRISGGSEPEGLQGNNLAQIPIEIIGVAESASVQGTVWLDGNSDGVRQPGESVLSDWTVELLKDGVLVATQQTNAQGEYHFTNLPPGSGYDIRFRHPETRLLYGNPVTNEQGNSDNPANASVNGGYLQGMELASGQNYVEQSLPLDPAGVVYDAVTREPVSGAQVTLQGPAGFNPATHLLSGSANVVTGSDGFYQFLLMPGAPDGEYNLTITNYPSGYLQSPSTMIPACNGSLTVGATPSPALIQNSPLAPGSAVTMHEPSACDGILPGGSNTTQYYFAFNLSSTSADVLNNHIPLDPLLEGAVRVVKTTPKSDVSRGELVPYQISATNTLSSVLHNIVLQDQIPAGFQYVRGSASLNGFESEPEINGRNLQWPERTLAAGEEVIIQLLLVVGSGVEFNEYVNRAWALNSLANTRVSNIGTATVRVVPDPIFDCTDIIGQVFDDQNRDGYQNEGEPGIPRARLASPRGWLITTDDYGRFHVACADVPSELRGGNFILKLDERSLPSGYRVTTENPRVVRVTQGRMVKLNFGAAIHRVVRLDLSSAVFTEAHELRPNYAKQMQEVLPLLQEEPSILRIAYQLDMGGDIDHARERIGAVRAWLEEHWEEQGCCYDLRIEEEIVPGAERIEVTQ
ncbi:SdrD B-like domain-containing protein [Nitrincola sp.]|uniref:DUF7933 domain-containing protein n=1 Tax=Nitrincola sp. TaxID=1926584 RepID=UPI003A94299F